ncbi:hypothetical protein [Bauldia sp.]|uniref:hypothetical protein n=1 Tax=Bauldia sp. TaxID=2575872 RepID=UPI003BAC78B3
MSKAAAAAVTAKVLNAADWDDADGCVRQFLMAASRYVFAAPVQPAAVEARVVRLRSE